MEPKTRQEIMDGKMPENAVLKVNVRNAGAAYNLCCGEAYVDAHGRIILDGQVYLPGEKAYLWNEKFYKSPPAELMASVKERILDATGVLDGIKAVMWKIKWNEPKTIKSEVDWLFGKIVTDIENPKRYPGLDMNNGYIRHSVRLAEKYMTKPDIEAYIEGKTQDELNGIYGYVFEVGGILHVDGGARQLTHAAKTAIEMYQQLGGRLGHSALVSLDREEETYEAFPEMRGVISDEKKQPLKLVAKTTVG